jgi:hypothetical protein
VHDGYFSQSQAFAPDWKMNGEGSGDSSAKTKKVCRSVGSMYMSFQAFAFGHHLLALCLPLRPRDYIFIIII